MSWKVLEILKGLKSSIGPPEVIKSSWKVLQWSESIRSSGPQNVLKRSTKSSRSQENVQKVPKVLRPQVLNWSSKCPQFPQKVIKALDVHRGPQKVFKTTSNSSKSYQRPQNPVIVKSSSDGHQMVLTKSSKFPKNSPQKVGKVLKNSRKCTKGTQGPRSPQASTDPQNILKRSRKCTKGNQRPQDWVPRMILKLLKSFSKSSKSWKVLKR